MLAGRRRRLLLVDHDRRLVADAEGAHGSRRRLQARKHVGERSGMVGESSMSKKTAPGMWVRR